MNRFPYSYTLYPPNQVSVSGLIHETLAEAKGEDDVLGSTATFFSFNEAESAEDPNSETSPISSVSGRLSEDSTPSNCKQKTVASKINTKEEETLHKKWICSFIIYIFKNYKYK